MDALDHRYAAALLQIWLVACMALSNVKAEIYWYTGGRLFVGAEL